MNALYRRRQEWESFRLYQPPGSHQSAEVLHQLLLQLWARTKRGWWSPASQRPAVALLRAIRAAPGQVDRIWSVPRALASFVRQELTEAYRPGAPEPFSPETTTPGRHTAGAVLRLAKPACFGLAPFRGALGRDLAAALEGLQPSEAVTLQLLLIPVRDGEWKPTAHAAFRKATQLQADGSTVTQVAARWSDDMLAPLDDFLGLSKGAHTTMRRDVADAVERAMVKEAPSKLKDHAFEVVSRIVATAPIKARAVSLVHAVSAQFAGIDDANQVIARRAWAPRRLWRLVQKRWPTGRGALGPALSWPH